MIASGATRKAGPYTGDGVTVSFPFTFKVFAAADLLVVQTDLTPIDTTQVLTSNYTVSLNANQDSTPGGSVTMVVAPPTGYLLTVGSQMANTQTLVIANLGGFYPTVINDALDRSMIAIAQLAEKSTRSLTLPFSSSAGVSTTLPVPVASNAIGWNATGTALVNYALQTGTSLVNLAAPGGSALIGYTPSGSGAVVTTMYAKMLPYVCAFDFMSAAQIADVRGYVGSIDVTAALNLAFAQVGKIVYCPAGIYRIASNLNPPSCNGIVGDGWQPGAAYIGTYLNMLGTVGLDMRNNNCLLLRDFCLIGNNTGTANATGLLIGNGTGTVSATFTGSIAGTTLTVSGISGTVQVGHTVFSNGGLIITQGTYITAQLTGSAGSNGTYTVNNSQTVGSLAMFSNGLYTWDYGRIQNVRIMNFAGTNNIGMHLRNANFGSFDGLHIDGCTQLLKTSVASAQAGTVPADCWFKDFTGSSSGAEGLIFGSGTCLNFTNPRISGTTKEAFILDPSLADGAHPVQVSMYNLEMENIYATNNSFYHIKVNSLSSGAVTSTLMLDTCGFETNTVGTDPNPKFLYATGSNSKVFLNKTQKLGNIPTPADTAWLVSDSGAKIFITDWCPGNQVMANASCTGGTSGTIEGDNVETVFTPVFVNLTNTGGAPTVIGWYTKRGKVVTWEVKITPVTSTTSAAAGTTSFTGLPNAAAVGHFFPMLATVESMVANPFPNIGMYGDSGGVLTGYCPQWTALTGVVHLSGTYILGT